MERLESVLKRSGESTIAANSRAQTAQRVAGDYYTSFYTYGKTGTANNKNPEFGVYYDARWGYDKAPYICQNRDVSPISADMMWWTPTEAVNTCGGFRNTNGQRNSTGHHAGLLVRVDHTDPTICSHFGTVPAYAASGKQAYDPSHPVKCGYDPDQLVQGGCQAVTEWTDYKRNEYMGDRGYFDDVMMEKMCSRAADPAMCPSTSQLLDATGKKICSNMIACPMCREWAFSSAARAAKADTIMANWCADKAHTPDNVDVDDPKVADEACRCLNRNRSKILAPFLNSTSALPIGEPRCWYQPCSSGVDLQRYFTRSSERTGPCPDFCANIINFGNAHNIDMNNVEMVNSCKNQIPTPPPTPPPPPGPGPVPPPTPPGPGPNPPPTPPPNPPTPDPEWLVWAKANKKTLAVGGGSAVAAIAGLVLIKILMKKMKN